MKVIYKNICMVALPLIFTIGCTERMEDMNVDPRGFQESDLYADFQNVKSFIPTLENNINEVTTSWMYQVQQNLNADLFSGYMMSANFFGRASDNSNYNLVDGWNGFIASVPQTTLSTMLQFEEELQTLAVSGDYLSVGLIIKVISVHRMIDAFGPYPYTRYGEGTDVAWDDIPDIYDAFFEELDFAIDTLSSYIGTDFENRIGDADISTFEGNYIKWIKLANTMKLRLAMRISLVDPATAQEKAEEAANHEYGVLEQADGIFAINHNFSHPLWTISQSWKDIQMGSDMESFLSGFADPRIGEFFTPAADPVVAGQYKGIRQGILRDDKSVYQDYSGINFRQSSPVVIITAAESYFLRAEAALNGWDMGDTDAQTLYEDGVKASFSQYGLGGADAYLTSSLTPEDYTDPKNSDYDYSAITTVTPNWADAATDEERLEKIITQKWIAIFPDGAEAWAEFRRTGYPQLQPIYSNQSTEIPIGEFIKRIPYPSIITSASANAYSNAINSFLGGIDSPNTRLWWDVD
ncbi:MAG: SusD/RagB family nutrient-binding outer membrane lipoprotein [Bacteroidales bacterium]|nr:SusD/RagB family nutrient-binding outer membrane lipoprotein [Bacteroidales bacterium]